MNLHNGLTENSLKDLLKRLFLCLFASLRVLVISRYGNENFFASIVTQAVRRFCRSLLIAIRRKTNNFSIRKEFLCLFAVLRKRLLAVT
jgi:hypothetical protein